MIKFQQLPDNIELLIPQVTAYLKSNPHIIFAYLFGSFAKEKQQSLSDIDIAVYLKQGTNVAECKLAILERMIDILQTDEIDLVVLNSANLPLVINVLKSKKIIVDKEPFARHIFESLAMRKYFDFSIREIAILQRRYFHG
jgi:predicted nucleotidyltransferase